MLKYVSKFVLDILPSVVATIIGAYIVNHYIVAKPASDAAVAAAVSTVLPKAEAKVISKPEGVPSDAALAIPETVPTKSKASIEKAAEKSAEATSAPAEVRRHQPNQRDKATKAAQTPAVTTPVAASTAAVPTENSSAAEERRDANELARAAIERLRASGEPVRAQEAARAQEVRAQEQPHVGPTPSVQALPPPIMVSTPRTEHLNPVTGSLKSSDAAATRTEEDARRPPAEIPLPPMDLHAEVEPLTPSHTTVADDVLLAAKSVFHAVIAR